MQADLPGVSLSCFSYLTIFQLVLLICSFNHSQLIKLSFYLSLNLNIIIFDFSTKYDLLQLFSKIRSNSYPSPSQIAPLVFGKENMKKYEKLTIIYEINQMNVIKGMIKNFLNYKRQQIALDFPFINDFFNEVIVNLDFSILECFSHCYYFFKFVLKPNLKNLIFLLNYHYSCCLFPGY